MSLSSVVSKTTSVPEFLTGGGEMGQRIREYDWSQTSLGPVDTWPQSLRTVVSICLNSNFPIAIYWGKDLTLIYNNAWSSIPGNKHPAALGRTAKEVWPDIWDAIEPQFEKAFGGEPGGSKDALLAMRRHGYTEECYFDFTFTPVYGEDGKVDGVFNAVIETTYRVTNERRTDFLKNFALQIALAQTSTDVFEKAIQILKTAPQDVPFALIYSFKDGRPVLQQSTMDRELSDASSPLPWPFEVLSRTGQSYHITDLRQYISSPVRIFWEEEITEAYVVPLKSGDTSVSDFLVCGISARRRFDAEYKVFVESIASAIATAINTISSLEAERKRAEALSEIDRAKTTFFSNISHEFRTPLTLLLGPIEDALKDPSTHPENKTRMDVAYRNALRMQKLVNTLLEFSRIEAGRVEGRFVKVDICTFTQDLASTFRSAIEKAGMHLKFDHGHIKDEVYVDVDMWEKIVLNLISNAFKYSKKGTITVSIKQVDNSIEFSVSDTGVGIPGDQLDKIFDRFHRIENIQGRSQEGTGIGLAMVKELVKLHQGDIRVSSKLGEGSTFTVSLPIGKEHLPADKIISEQSVPSNYSYASAFVQEAMKWSGENERPHEVIDDFVKESAHTLNQDKKYKVLLADDNADMRDYVKRLLSDHFEVVTAIDGEDAFEKLLQHNPDLVLSDIMMPRLDGFGLLEKIRQVPDRKNTPVIFLSARAGEEAKVEGLDAGADDYLVKPFSARELLARVDANIKISRARIAAENNLRNMIRQAPVATVVLRGASMIVEIVNDRALEVWGRNYNEVINRPITEAVPEIVGQGFDQLLAQVYATGEPFYGNEVPANLVRFGKPETVHLNFIYEPLRSENGEVVGVIGVAVDVTEQVNARRRAEQSEKELTELANAVPQLVWVADAKGEIIYYNDRVSEFDGAIKVHDGNWKWEGLVHPDELTLTQQVWNEAVKNKTVYQIEHRIKLKNGEYRWFLSRSIPHKDEEGNVIKWFGTATDIHASKMQAAMLEEEVKRRTKELNESNFSLQQSNGELQQFAHVASHDLKEPLRKIKTFASRLAEDENSSFSENGRLYLRKMNSAADRMNIMIEGVLNYSMLSAVRQKIESVDLNETIRHIESDLEVLIAQKSATIRVGNLPVLKGASVLLYQLFYNLINNSLKFSKPDEEPLITISSSLKQEDNRPIAEIIVRDNGIGFEQEFAERIFETFLRLNSKDQFEGTGLGLSLCKRIVERHHGTIMAFGEPGKGSTFIIRLPLEQETKKAELL